MDRLSSTLTQLIGGAPLRSALVLAGVVVLAVLFALIGRGGRARAEPGRPRGRRDRDADRAPTPVDTP